MKRLIDDFFVQKKESCSAFGTQLLLERIQSDLQLLGSDGEVLDGAIKRLLSELRKLRAAGQHRLVSEQWAAWSGVLAAMQKNPLQFSVEVDEGIPHGRAGSHPPSLQDTDRPAIASAEAELPAS